MLIRCRHAAAAFLDMSAIFLRAIACRMSFSFSSPPSFYASRYFAFARRASRRFLMLPPRECRRRFRRCAAPLMLIAFFMLRIFADFRLRLAAPQDFRGDMRHAASFAACRCRRRRTHFRR